MTVKNMPVPDNMKPLHQYLLVNHLIEDLDGINPDYLKIHYSDLLKSIRSGDPESGKPWFPPRLPNSLKTENSSATAAETRNNIRK